MKTEMTFTDKETALINAIMNSDYMVEISDPVWLPDAKECGFDNNSTLSGVVSQLVQKGIIVTSGKGNDAVVSFTQKYLDSLTA